MKNTSSRYQIKRRHGYLIDSNVLIDKEAFDDVANAYRLGDLVVSDLSIKEGWSARERLLADEPLIVNISRQLGYEWEGTNPYFYTTPIKSISVEKWSEEKRRYRCSEFRREGHRILFESGCSLPDSMPTEYDYESVSGELMREIIPGYDVAVIRQKPGRFQMIRLFRAMVGHSLLTGVCNSGADPNPRLKDGNNLCPSLGDFDKNDLIDSYISASAAYLCLFITREATLVNRFNAITKILQIQNITATTLEELRGHQHHAPFFKWRCPMCGDTPWFSRVRKHYTEFVYP